MTIGSTNATLSFAPATTLTVSGLLVNDGAITVGSGDALSLFTNQNGTFGFGTLLNAGSITLNGGGLIAGEGTIADSGIIEGSGTISGVLTGTGIVDAGQNGMLDITNPITSGSVQFRIENAGTLKVDTPVTSNADFDFKSDGVLEITPFFAGTVSGMTVGTSATQGTTVIDVQEAVTSAVLSGTSLSVSGPTDFTIQFANSFPAGTNVVLAPDTVRGGTDIFFASTQIGLAPCYVAGTRILTPDGERPIETLSEGDLVVVLSGTGRTDQKVKWIGQRVVELNGHPRRDLAAPVRIRRDAMGVGQPHRDLLVSPDHCLFIDGKLIPALMLVNDMTIVQECDRARVHYFHVELAQHAVVLAEGLAAETYLDTGNRALFANAGVSMLLHPEFRVNESLRTWQDDACAPLVVDPDALQPVWQHLAGRAETLGFVPRQLTMARDPDLHLVVAGRRIAPVEIRADRYVFMLPKNVGPIRVLSRATRPAEVVRYLDDRRKLGVAVGSITLRAGDDVTVFPADRLPAGSGWHAHESHDGALWRWTDGDAELLIDPVKQPAMMEVRLSGSAEYIIEMVAAREAA